jgi:hypothetical protein
MKSSPRFACLLIAMAIAFSASARAGELPIDISAFANEPWVAVPNGCGLSNGDTYPAGAQNFGGVPFEIPTAPNNYWSACAAANFGSGTVSLTVPVHISA